MYGQSVPTADGRVLRGGGGDVLVLNKCRVCSGRKHLPRKRYELLAESMSAATGRVLRRKRRVYADRQCGMFGRLPGERIGVHPQSVYATYGHLLRDERFLQLDSPERVRGCLDDRRRVCAESVPAAHGQLLRDGWIVHNEHAGQLSRDVEQRRELRSGESMSAAERIVLRGGWLLYPDASSGVLGGVGHRQCVQSEPVSAPIRRVL